MQYAEVYLSKSLLEKLLVMPDLSEEDEAQVKGALASLMALETLEANRIKTRMRRNSKGDLELVK